MYIVDPFSVLLLQLCARHEDRTCTRYVTPSRPVEQKAGEVNGINYNKALGEMTYRNNRVKHISLHKALLEFLDFLSGIRSPVLVAHNGKAYDFIILHRVATATGLLPQFKSRVCGFMDSLQLCRNLLPGFERHSLKALSAGLIGGGFELHNAKNDCIALEKIVSKLRPSSCTLERFSFGWETVIQKTVRRRAKLFF